MGLTMEKKPLHPVYYGGKPWIEAAVLKQAIMTPEQQQIADRGTCPRCSSKLLRSLESKGVRFSRCEQCSQMFVLK